MCFLDKLLRRYEYSGVDYGKVLFASHPEAGDAPRNLKNANLEAGPGQYVFETIQSDGTWLSCSRLNKGERPSSASTLFAVRRRGNQIEYIGVKQDGRNLRRRNKDEVLVKPTVIRPSKM